MLHSHPIFLEVPPGVFRRILYANGGVIVPGVPCRDRGNWDLESLRDRSHACLGKMEFRAFPKRVVHEFYPLKALITLEQVNTTE